MKTTLRILLIAAALFVAACGNKGALVMPDKAGSSASPASPASDSPASPASSAG